MTADEKNRITLWIEKTIEAIEKLDGVIRGSTGVLYCGEDGLKTKDELERLRGDMYLKFLQYCKEKDIWKYYVEYKNESTLEFIKGEFHKTSSGKYTNSWGDEYEYNPFTGILEQTTWGL